MDSSTSTLWSGLFSVEGEPVLFLLLSCSIEIPAFNVNSAETDQTLQHAASDQSLHCLLMSLFMGR